MLHCVVLNGLVYLQCTPFRTWFMIAPFPALGFSVSIFWWFLRLISICKFFRFGILSKKKIKKNRQGFDFYLYMGDANENDSFKVQLRRSKIRLCFWNESLWNLQMFLAAPLPSLARRLMIRSVPTSFKSQNRIPAFKNSFFMSHFQLICEPDDHF